MLDYFEIDRSKLTDLQRRNLAAWKIKQYELEQQHGDKIEIADSAEDVLRMRYPLAIPLSSLSTGKQVSIMMDELREEVNGDVKVVHTKDQFAENSAISDVTRELEEQVELYERLKQARLNRGRAPKQLPKNGKVVVVDGVEYVIPEGYDVVKPEQTVSKAAVNILADEPAAPISNALGTPIQESCSRKEVLKSLLDQLL